jgi:uncharacterized membrane protein
MAETPASQPPEQLSADEAESGSRSPNDDRRIVTEPYFGDEEQLEQERRVRRASQLQAALWAVIGAIVVLYVFFALLGAVDPVTASGPTIVIIVLAVLWLAHAWRRLRRGGHVSRSDRERRGF